MGVRGLTAFLDRCPFAWDLLALKPQARDLSSSDVVIEMGIWVLVLLRPRIQHRNVIRCFRTRLPCRNTRFRKSLSYENIKSLVLTLPLNNMMKCMFK